MHVVSFCLNGQCMIMFGGMLLGVSNGHADVNNSCVQEEQVSKFIILMLHLMSSNALSNAPESTLCCVYLRNSIWGLNACWTQSWLLNTMCYAQISHKHLLAPIPGIQLIYHFSAINRKGYIECWLGWSCHILSPFLCNIACIHNPIELPYTQYAFYVRGFTMRIWFIWALDQPSVSLNPSSRSF